MPQESPEKKKSSANPYRTVSASERRARRMARETSKARRLSDEGRDDVRATERKPSAAAALPQEVINELLANPTKVVTEDDLRRDYSYVIADLRSMALLAAALVVLLVALAFVLPR